MEINVNNVCWCCLAEENLKNGLEFYDKEKSLRLLDILSMLTTIQTQEDDNKMFCQNCILELKRFYNFKLFCERSNTILTAQISNKIKVYNSCTEKQFDFSSAYDESEANDTTYDYNLSTKNYKVAVSKIPPYVCDICCKELPTYRKLYKHIYAHKSKNMKCPECSYVCSKSRLRIHMRKHNGHKPFSCNICGLNFTMKYNLNRHVERHIKAYQCEACGKKFPNESALGVHLNSHYNQCIHNLEKTKCLKCMSSKKYESKPMLCNYCGKILKSKLSLSLHEEHHCKVRNDKSKSVCEICNKSYSSSVCLKYHKKLCHNEKQYECNLCKKKFSLKVNLDVHIKAHNNAFSCLVCKKSFNCQGSLNKHNMIHLSIFPYSCNVCHKLFRQTTHIKQHMVTHTKEKKFECLICLKKFGVKGNLNKHIKSVHIVKDKQIKDVSNEVMTWINKT